MRFFIITLLLIMNVTAAAGQQYSVKEIISRGDDLITNRLKGFSDYVKISEGSYYSYSVKGKLHYKLLTDKKNTEKNFRSAVLIYQFSMHYANCPMLDTIKSDIMVTLDTNLISATLPDISFLSQMVLKNEKCNFIAMNDAIKIAVDNHLKLGVTKPYAILKYNKDEKRYVWAVHSTLWNDMDYNNDNLTKQDIAEIDAESGNILSHKIIPYTEQLSQ